MDIRVWVGGRPYIREIMVDGSAAQLVSADEGDGPRMLNPQATKLWWKEMARRTGLPAVVSTRPLSVNRVPRAPAGTIDFLEGELGVK